MADNATSNTEPEVQKVIENNQKLAQIAQNQADVITELRQMNSDKDLKIAELSATIKRFQTQIQVAAQAQQQVDDVDTEFEEVGDDEGAEDEQE